MAKKDAYCPAGMTANKADKWSKNSAKAHLDAGAKNLTGEGFAGKPLVEAIPRFLATPSEKVISGDNNAYIVLGRDRAGHFSAGYGAKGYSGAGTIDIVVGRMASEMCKPNPTVDEATYVNPSFFADGARIYISQMTDIDLNFQLADGTIGSVKGLSGIGIKADSVRIIGKAGGVKIVSGKADTAIPVEKTARGGKIRSPNGSGIELIAGKNTDDRVIIYPTPAWVDNGMRFRETYRTLQPIALGYNVRDALLELAYYVNDRFELIQNFMSAQLVYNATNNIDAFRPHVPAVGVPETIRQLITAWAPDKVTKGTYSAWELNYMWPTGYKFIGSHNVRAT